MAAAAQRAGLGRVGVVAILAAGLLGGKWGGRSECVLALVHSKVAHEHLIVVGVLVEVVGGVGESVIVCLSIDCIEGDVCESAQVGGDGTIGVHRHVTVDVVPASTA